MLFSRGAKSIENFLKKFQKTLAKWPPMVYNIFCFGGIAQLVRAFGSHPRGHRFEPYCLHQSQKPLFGVVFVIHRRFMGSNLANCLQFAAFAVEVLRGFAEVRRKREVQSPITKRGYRRYSLSFFGAVSSPLWCRQGVQSRLPLFQNP